MTALVIIAILAAIAIGWLIHTTDIIIVPMEEPQALDDEHLAQRAREDEK